VPNKIKTILLYANGEPYKKRIIIDSVLRGLLRVPYDYTASGFIHKIDKLGLIQRMLCNHYEKLSYTQDWKEAIVAHSDLDVELCNVNNIFEYKRFSLKAEHYDLIIVMHSVLGDSCELLKKTVNYFDKRKGKLIIFIGNEYDIMDEKIAVLKNLEADYICSQLPINTAKWLYEEVKSARVLAMPHALNPDKFSDLKLHRIIDIGFIGAAYPLWIGDSCRNDFFNQIIAEAERTNFICDVKIGEGNLSGSAWGLFLNSIKGTIGAESGSYYLDREGTLIKNAKEIISENPFMSLEELVKKAFQDSHLKYMTGKCVSSRHFEAIGCKTCQILLEGDYNGILVADKHYFSVKKDLSNIKEVLDRFSDELIKKEMIKNAYSLIIENHTYAHRVRSLIEQVYF